VFSRDHFGILATACHVSYSVSGCNLLWSIGCCWLFEFLFKQVALDVWVKGLLWSRSLWAWLVFCFFLTCWSLTSYNCEGHVCQQCWFCRRCCCFDWDVFSVDFGTCDPGARCTKYLTTVLQLSYNNAKVTIDLWRTSHLPDILRRTQGLSWVQFTCKIVRSSDIMFAN